MASVRNKSINLDTSALREHRFFRQYKKANTHNFYVDGEEFVEPLEKRVVFCGTTTSDLEKKESTLNSKGLFDSLYIYSTSGNYLIYYARYRYYEEP